MMEQKKRRTFFLDDNMKPSYFRICQDCDRSCKQSFRVIDVYCPYYERLKKERRKKVSI